MRSNQAGGREQLKSTLWLLHWEGVGGRGGGGEGTQEEGGGRHLSQAGHFLLSTVRLVDLLRWLAHKTEKYNFPFQLWSQKQYSCDTEIYSHKSCWSQLDETIEKNKSQMQCCSQVKEHLNCCFNVTVHLHSAVKLPVDSWGGVGGIVEPVWHPVPECGCDTAEWPWPCTQAFFVCTQTSSDVTARVQQGLATVAKFCLNCPENTSGQQNIEREIKIPPPKKTKNKKKTHTPRAWWGRDV